MRSTSVPPGWPPRRLCASNEYICCRHRSTTTPLPILLCMYARCDQTFHSLHRTSTSWPKNISHGIGDATKGFYLWNFDLFHKILCSLCSITSFFSLFGLFWQPVYLQKYLENSPFIHTLIFIKRWLNEYKIVSSIMNCSSETNSQNSGETGKIILNFYEKLNFPQRWLKSEMGKIKKNTCFQGLGLFSIINMAGISNIL